MRISFNYSMNSNVSFSSVRSLCGTPIPWNPSPFAFDDFIILYRSYKIVYVFEALMSYEAGLDLVDWFSYDPIIFKLYSFFRASMITGQSLSEFYFFDEDMISCLSLTSQVEVVSNILKLVAILFMNISTQSYWDNMSSNDLYNSEYIS